jgi:hypothetical protein
MPAPYHGACACGAASAVIDAEPLFVRQCWCRQCQKIASGGATTNALFAVSAIAMSGELSWHKYPAASGNTVEQGFCATCGTAIVACNSGRPGFNVVRLGFLDDAGDLMPTAAIWTDEAPKWTTIDPALERHGRQPPPLSPPPAG